MSIPVKLDERARLQIPAEVRRDLGFHEGDLVWIEPLGPGEFRVVRLGDRIQAARGLFRSLKKPGEDVTGELLAERRQEAAREAGADA